jgi:hypothetical protein
MGRGEISYSVSTIGRHGKSEEVNMVFLEGCGRKMDGTFVPPRLSMKGNLSEGFDKDGQKSAFSHQRLATQQSIPGRHS